MELAPLLRAAELREPLLDARHAGAVRLFNGFTEGLPVLVVDLYARTLVVHDHAGAPDGDEALARAAAGALRERFPFVRAALWKARKAASVEARHGRLLFGGEADLDRRVEEDGVRYALALAAGRDASFYLDTRGLRAWARRELAGRKVLNTFAHTGSLGVAARAAPAAAVVHTDLARPALDVAKESYALNGFPVRRADFVTGDFFEVTSRLRRANRLFDCVFLDPPFFSATEQGRVDLLAEGRRLLDKCRPLVAHEGRLAVVNNALYLPGAEWLRTLEEAGAGGYAEVERLVPVPDDVTGLAREGAPAWPADPAPFNHPTKIAILRLRRKDGRRA